MVTTRKKAAAKKKSTAKRRPRRPKAPSKSKLQSVNFHYIKGPDFRSVHIDGAIGGLTTKGFLHIALFAERAPIPQEITFEVLPDGRLGEEDPNKRVSKEGVIRQMEVDVIVNEETAKDLRNWLDQRLADFDERRKQIAKLEK